MSNIGEYNAAAAQYASSAIATTNNLLQSTHDKKWTKDMANYQLELQKKAEQYNHNRQMSAYVDAAKAARDGGFSALAAIGHDPMSNAQQLGGPSMSQFSSKGAVAPDFSSSLLLDKQLEKLDADIQAVKTDTAAKQSGLDTNFGVNSAIQEKLKGLGYDVPIQNAEGFFNGLSSFDAYMSETDDRSLKRLANDNQRFIEKLKSSPDAQKKITEGFYAELEKSLVSLEDQKVLLKGHHLDNSKKWQDIKIGEQQYRLVKADLYSKLYDNQFIKPLERAKLESDVSSAQTNSEYLMFKLDSEKWNHYNSHMKSNPWYWYDLRDKEFEEGDYYEASKSWFLGGLYFIPDLVSTGLGKLIK